MKSFLSFLLLAAICFTACNTSTETRPAETAAAPVFNLDSVKAAIAASNQLFNESFAKADSALFLDRYTSDAIFMAPNMPALNGSAAMMGFYNAALTQMGVKAIVLNTVSIYGEGDYVTEEGTYELFVADNKSVDKGKYLVLWKKTDAGWKMYRDIFNSDNPPPPAAPAK